MGSIKISKNYKTEELKGGFWVKTKKADEVRYMLEKWLSLYGNTRASVGTELTNNYSVKELISDIEDFDYRGVSFTSLPESAKIGKGNFEFLNVNQRKKQLEEYIEAHNKYNPGSLTKDFKDINIVETYDITNGNEDVEEICISFKDFEKAFLYFTEQK